MSVSFFTRVTQGSGTGYGERAPGPQISKNEALLVSSTSPRCDRNLNPRKPGLDWFKKFRFIFLGDFSQPAFGDAPMTFVSAIYIRCQPSSCALAVNIMSRSTRRWNLHRSNGRLATSSILTWRLSSNHFRRYLIV